ncbi:glutamic acid-rich protein-like [Pecten maximus]|uniref:glutamic acid-rich protein-like n=1 Tax=Pecten maximus TaxID=6579 RepID=UPI001458F578|nr:glutamic acid-rich protein-like [Pecten maximus]
MGHGSDVTVFVKNDKTVPILVPEDVKKAPEFITSANVRRAVGVKSWNNYVFANTGDGVMRAYDSLKAICGELSLGAPDRITSVSMRKYIVTLSQVIDMKEHELEWLCNHLDHTAQIHKLHYRSTSGFIERVNIGKLMLLQDVNLAGKYAGKRLKDINLAGGFSNSKGTFFFRLQSYASRSKGLDAVDESLAADLSEVEKKLLETQDLMKVRGKMLNLDKYQMDWILNHLGHTRAVHKEHYRQMSGLLERTQVSKMLLVQDMNLMSKFKGKRLEEVDIRDIVFPDQEKTDDEPKDLSFPTDSLECEEVADVFQTEKILEEEKSGDGDDDDDEQNCNEEMDTDDGGNPVQHKKKKRFTVKKGDCTIFNAQSMESWKAKGLKALANREETLKCFLEDLAWAVKGQNKTLDDKAQEDETSSDKAQEDETSTQEEETLDEKVQEEETSDNKAQEDETLDDKAQKDEKLDDKAQKDEKLDDKAQKDEKSDDEGVEEDETSDDEGVEGDETSDDLSDEKGQEDETSDDKAQEDETSSDKAQEDETSDDKAQEDDTSDDKAQEDETSSDKAQEDETLDDKVQEEETSDNKAQEDDTLDDKAQKDEKLDDKAQEDETSDDEGVEEDETSDDE